MAANEGEEVQGRRKRKKRKQRAKSTTVATHKRGVLRGRVHLTWKQGVPVVVTIGCLLCLGYWSFRAAPGNVSAVLSTVRRVRLQFASSGSPVVNPREITNPVTAERGTGLGFFGQQMTLGARSPKTQFTVVSPPAESVWDQMVEGFSFSVSLVRFTGQNVLGGYKGNPTIIYPDDCASPRIRARSMLWIDSGFLPEDLLKADFRHANILEKRDFGEAYRLNIRSRELNVMQFGKAPFAAFCPRRDSAVTIEYFCDYMDLREEALGVARKALEAPFVDLMGKPVFLSMEMDSTVVIDGNEVTKGSVEETADRRQEIVVLIIRPQFSLRMAIDPTSTAKEAEKLVGISVANEKDIDDVFNKAKTAFDSYREIEVTNGEWANVGDIRAMHPSSPDRQHFNKHSDHVRFEYPYLPDSWGVSLYGPVVSLEMEGVTGSIVVGGKAFNLGAPTTIALRRIRYIKPQGESLLMMPKEVSIFAASVGEVSIERGIAYRNVDRYTELITVVSVLLAVAGLVLGWLGRA